MNKLSNNSYDESIVPVKIEPHDKIESVKPSEIGKSTANHFGKDFKTSYEDKNDILCKLGLKSTTMNSHNQLFPLNSNILKKMIRILKVNVFILNVKHIGKYNI